MPRSLRRPATLAGLVAALVLGSLPLLGRGALVEATSWIDAPLDGSVLPYQRHEIVAHSADQRGIAEVVFEVAGANVDAATKPGDGSQLLTTRFRWVPSGVGTFELIIRARNVDGEWGAPASATVVITDAAVPGPSLDPGASPVGSPGPSTSPGASVPPGQSPTPGPTLPPGRTGAPPTTPPTSPPTSPPITPAPTRVQPPTPAPTYCAPPTPILDVPADGARFDDSEGNPLFEWHYDGSTGCIASQVLYIVGADLSIDLDADARTYQQPAALPIDPRNIDDNQCAYYYWYVVALNAEGDGEPSARRSFDVCELNR